MYVLACSQHQAAAKWTKQARERRTALYKARAEGLRKIREDMQKIAQNEIDYAKKVFEDCMPVRIHVEKKKTPSSLASEEENDSEVDAR